MNPEKSKFGCLLKARFLFVRGASEETQQVGRVNGFLDSSQFYDFKFMFVIANIFCINWEVMMK